MSSDWYFRNRSRDAIINMIRVIRYLQLANGFKESEIMRAMAIVWRESGDQTSFATLYLFWMIRELEKDERSCDLMQPRKNCLTPAVFLFPKK